ncbi:hypothetical protein NM688_g8412 [Phlebia brevispora]|uniref:Uncharacterized protein n=1 Tax=Phlebia brevispora TaxID=194682 RepID=A0ACC1RU05_9APHY|nr:hypothetical protein NM688_g8412 [Phlebia brevispora]
MSRRRSTLYIDIPPSSSLSVCLLGHVRHLTSTLMPHTSASECKRLALRSANYSALDHWHIPLYRRTSDGVSMIYLLNTEQNDLAFNHCVNASPTIVCYDFIATSQYEYELVWHRKWTGATWLFLANRCSNFSSMCFLIALTILPGITVAVFSALRVFALLDRAYITASLTLILGLAGVVLNFALRATISTCYHRQLCFTTLASTWCAIAADIIAIAITWIKTYRLVREASSVDVRIGSMSQKSAAHRGTYPASRAQLPDADRSQYNGNLGELLAYAEELEVIYDEEDTGSEGSEVGSSAVWNSGEGEGSSKLPNVDTIKI